MQGMADGRHDTHLVTRDAEAFDIVVLPGLMNSKDQIDLAAIKVAPQDIVHPVHNGETELRQVHR